MSRFQKNCESFLKKIYKEKPQKFKAVSSLILKFTKKRNESNPLETLKKLGLILNDNIKLIEDLNKLLHVDIQVQINPLPQSISLKQQKERFKHFFELYPEKSKTIIWLLEKAKNSNNPNSEEFLETCKEYLDDTPDLLEDFKEMLNDAKNQMTQQNQKNNISVKSQNSNKSNVDTNSFYYSSSESNFNSENEKIRNNFKVSKSSKKIHHKTIDYSLHKNNQNCQKSFQPTQQQIIKQTQIDINLQQNNANNHINLMNISNKNEFSFFECLKVEFGAIKYNFLIKCIFLFCECIITFSELTMLVRDLFPHLSDKLLLVFKDIMLTRESSRRKNTPFFKPLGEVNFSSKY